MNNNENIYDDWRRTLDGLGLQTDDRSQQKARVVAARAQVDQAISLATIADSLDQLVAHFTGRPTDVPVGEMPEPDPQGIQSEHDVQVGDMVAAISGGMPLEVSEVGIDQGDLWLKLEDAPGKVWASQYVVVEHGADAEPEPLGADVLTPEMAQAVPDDIDDDFASEPTDTDEQQADALAALRARQGKGKKATRKP